MANPLTGDYEAVLQVATRQIAGLLGTLHQNGAQQNNPMTLPHSEAGRVGDPHRRPPIGGVATTGVFADWVSAYQRRGPGHGLREIETQVTGAAPPGAALMLADAFKALRGGGIVIDPVPPEVVRGLAKMQLSSFGITVTQGSTSEVTVSTALRARYYPDQGAAQLPVPIHGTVQATFKVRKINTASGPKLIILPSTDDSKIQFIAAPGSGMTAADQTTLSVEVRKTLRDSMTPAPAALPANFPFSDFKGLGSGASQAIALPFQLSGAAAPASGLQPLNQSFIGSSGFAVAVSSAYVSGLFDLDAIRQAVAAVSFTVNVSVGFYSDNVTYKLRFTSGPTLTFQSGGIELAGTIAAETNTWWAPNGSVSFKQTIRLMLDVPSQTVTPMRFGDPQVDESWYIPHQTAVNAVKTQINDALAANTPAVRQVFTHGKTTLLDGLSAFDPVARATYTGIDITPDGIIIHGEIGSGPRRPPVVAIAETENATAFTAFESWLPAGGIDRFIWSWIEYPSNYGIWNGVQKSFTDAHRFIFPETISGNAPQPDLPAHRRHANLTQRTNRERCRRNDVQRGRTRSRAGLAVVVWAGHAPDLAARHPRSGQAARRHRRPYQRRRQPAGHRAAVAQHVRLFPRLDISQAAGVPENRVGQGEERRCRHGRRRASARRIRRIAS